MAPLVPLKTADPDRLAAVFGHAEAIASAILEKLEGKSVEWIEQVSYEQYFG